MPPDVHRMMEREAEEINATIICNKKAYADLIATLQKGGLLWVTVDYCGLLWVVVGYSGLPWVSVGCYGLLMF